MTPLELTITDAGLAAIQAAQGSAAVVITGVGLTAADFVEAPTLTVLPGEFKRLVDVSGDAVDARTVHLVARDDGTDVYTVRGFGLFLADGTLLATYAQAVPIFTKSAVSTFLLAQDIRFQAGQATSIAFGDANFLYPPATEVRKGVAEIADQPEVDAGADDERIVTSKKLAARLAGFLSAIFGRKILTAGLANGGGDLSGDRTIDVPRASPEEALAGSLTSKALAPSSLALILLEIFDRVVRSRKVSTSGLATGGGDLTADRTIDVAAASVAQLRALASDAVALTPATYGALGRSLQQNGYTELPDGFIIKCGRFTCVANGVVSISFPVAFPNECFAAVTGGGLSGAADQDNYVSIIANTITAAGFQASNGKGAAYGCTYIAVGR
ncbi:MAG TPA: hypothetical protein VF628_11090 [Allosphingosinicella sp.]